MSASLKIFQHLATGQSRIKLKKLRTVLKHKLIKNFKPRLYQETIFATASQKNTLIVLPTGMGKTNIFLMLAAHRLSQYPNMKIVLLGPTRPLIDQYRQVFENNLDIDKDKIAVLTGFVKPEKRQELWKGCQLIFSTPQGLENDIISNRIDLKEVSLLGIDEAHRAVGDYSYVFIARQYQAKARYPRIVAMTASPGSDQEKINEVLQNLCIEDIEIRSDTSPDVAPYIQKLNIRWEKVAFPDELKNIRRYLKTCFSDKLDQVKKYGYISSVQLYSTSKKDLLALQAKLQGELSSGNRDFSVMRSVSLAAEALKVQHATELLETQSVETFTHYMEQLENQAHTSKVKAVQNLVKDINFRSALIKARTAMEKQTEHPKLAKLRELVAERITKQEHKMMIFTQYRDTGSKIVTMLEQLEGARPVLFVGQAKKNGSGLTQKRQLEILERFAEGEYNILVSSSVGEEGLDIPKVDSVIFYEPIPSEIRHIQRRGRTARLEKGQVIVLVAEGTRDEAYRWTAHHKEKRMHRTLDSLRQKMVFMKQDNDLRKYIPNEGVKIYADYREKGSKIIKELIDLGVSMRLEKLSSADYILSSRCGVEYKTTQDFVDSLVDGRLLQQVRSLKQDFERPLIVIEGQEDIYSLRNIHPNAIRGLIATISVSYGVPLLYTKNNQDTANILAVIAKREQDELGKDFSHHTSAKPRDVKEQQEYLISALPGIGGGLAKELLRTFGSVKAVFSATEEQLKEVELIGEKKAKKIRAVVDSDYQG